MDLVASKLDEIWWDPDNNLMVLARQKYCMLAYPRYEPVLSMIYTRHFETMPLGAYIRITSSGSIEVVVKTVDNTIVVLSKDSDFSHYQVFYEPCVEPRGIPASYVRVPNVYVK